MQCGNSNMASSPTTAESLRQFGTPSTAPTTVSSIHGDDDKSENNVSPVEGKVTSYANRPLKSFTRHGRLKAPPPLHIPPRNINTCLSPTAEVFTPVAQNHNHNFSATPTVNDHINTNVGHRDAGHSPVSQLLAHSIPDMPPYISQGLMQALQASPGIIGQPFSHFNPNLNSESLQPYHATIQLDASTVYKEGKFTVDEPYARAFTAFNISTIPGQLAAMFAPNKFPSLDHIDTRCLAQGNFSIGFTDIRDAKQAWALTKSAAGASMIIKLCPTAFAPKKNIPSGNVQANEGEYILRLLPRNGHRSQVIDLGELRSILLTFGDLKAVQTLNTDNAITTLRLEWCDVLNGTSAQTSLRNTRLPNGDVIHIERHIYQAINFEASRPTVHTRSLMSTEPAWDSHSRNTNHVDIDRILAGADVRTTIMLRNIPNRINQDALKSLLDRTSLGDYDFMYLRIDFANNCNVGYAFINFVDPAAIVPFARARAGRRWNVFNSDKVAEISYATIQGRDCLIQKFRNSSVMLEQGSFRPKLFRTGRGPEAGMEEPFPKPDNVSKLRRSCENAAHIGLYTTPSSASLHCPPPLTAPKNQAAGGVFTAPAPNRAIFSPGYPLTPVTPSTYPENDYLDPFLSRLYAPREGQAHRERQRRQHSQFDRGTPGAEHEARLRSILTTPPSSARTSHHDIEQDDSLFSLSEIRNVMGQLFYTPEQSTSQTSIESSFLNAPNGIRYD